MDKTPTFLDRLIERLDRLDPSSVQSYVLKLAREKGFLETVFNTIQEGIVVIDRDVRIRYINTMARELLGIPEEAEGQRLDRFLRDVDWVGLMAADARQWERVSFQEIEVFYPEPRVLSFSIVPHPVEDEDAGMQMATIILQDVTETRRQTEEAIESQTVAAITQLAAGVAHEIGNPLNSLTIHLQLLARELARKDSGDKQDSDPAEAKELVDVALQEVHRLDSIVNNFLRAIRPSRPELQPLQIQKVLAESLKFMRHEIEERHIRVEASLPDKLPRIQGDPSQLRQAFFNIIKNSIQAMSAGGLLSIFCEVDDTHVEIRFSDTGKGVPAEKLSHIMEPFYTTRADGTGLGLLEVERILRGHGADFKIESGAGAGTTFTIRLPLRERQVRLLAAAEQHVR
jgi:PAS domain S-box-containing protein